MKSLHVLLKSILHDCSILCGTTTTRDLLTVTRRVKAEGISFLTITLSDYATDFESCLERGYVEATDFRSFRKSGTIPCLFKGMFLQVFDVDGNLLREPSIAAIDCIRQVCRMWKKMLLPCTKARVSAAIDKYTECEESLSLLDLHGTKKCQLDPVVTAYESSSNLPRGSLSVCRETIFHDFISTSRRLWSPLTNHMSKLIWENQLVPKHGSGAVETKVLPNQKYVWRIWHERLETWFPSAEFCYSNYSNFLAESSKLDYLNPTQERPVRVVTVPKTLKTPRIIAIEPACMQYTQQALLQPMVRFLETHEYTKYHVNFTNQTINARLALVSSRRGHLATLDLSEASDRVHYDLVSAMLRDSPFLGAISACRSQSAKLPNGNTIRLEKFASMGSALCFPIESMVFYTILISSELRRLKLRLSKTNVKLVSRSIYVYGDDLIIPVEGVEHAKFYLETLGLKVNSRKSFSGGNFRESCGMDAYDGHNVTSCYVRRKLPSSKRDVEGFVSAVSLSNQLYKKGWFTTADYIESYLTSIGFDALYVTETSSCVGYKGRNKPLTIHRRCDKLHKPQVKGYVVVVKDQIDRIDGHSALMKWFLQGLNPDRKHFQHSVGNGRLAIKVRWCDVY